MVARERREQATPATVYEVELGELSIVPRKDASDHLMLAPGVLTANHGGEGHAHETFMRGFAAGSGQDIEFRVNGVPLNEVSNPHEHGYADVMFLLPEILHAVTVDAGPFDASQGDFAFAGSAEYRLGVHERGSRVSQGIGAFNSSRTVAIYAPDEQTDGTFGAFEFYRTDGFGVNRAAQRATVAARYESPRSGDADLVWAATALGYTARYDQAGVIRQDDFLAGRVGFFDTYDENQGGESTRLLLFFETTAGPPDARFEQVTWLQMRSMRGRENFTGFQEDDLMDDFGIQFVTQEQRGDGLEIRYDVLTGGSRGAYTLTVPAWGADQRLALGYTMRFDKGDASQRKLRAITAIPYQRVFEHELDVMNLAGWMRGDLRPLHWLSLRGGVRIDTFSFGVTNLDKPTADRQGLRLPDQTSQAFGFAINPRATVDVALGASGAHLVGSYGRGTRSTDAAALSDNEAAPFAQSHSFDLGTVFRRGTPQKDPWAFNLQASYNHTRVTNDLVFDQTAGRNIPVGGSKRHVLLGSSRLTVGSWLDTLLNLSWADATLDTTGDRIPYIPRFIGRFDTAITGALGHWSLGGVPVAGRLGVGVTYVPGRPLPLDRTGDDIFTVNVGGGVRLWHTTLGVQVRNLFDQRFRQSEFNYPSNFEGPNVPASRVATRHFAAGEPFFAMATLTLHVEDMLLGPIEADPKETHDAH